MSEQTQPQTRRDMEAHIIAKAWKDDAYKQELLSNSKAVIEREFNIQLPAQINVQVIEENPTSLYFVVPVRPEIAGQEISEEELQAIAGGVNAISSKVSAVVSIAGAAATVSAAVQAVTNRVSL